MLNIRDALLNDEDKKKFNEAYNPIIENFKGLLLSIKKLQKLKERHITEVNAGKIVKIRSNRQIDIEYSIDDDYREGIKDIYIKGAITIKGLPNLGKIFGLKIGFFFMDDQKFERELDNFLKEWGLNGEFILYNISEARSTWYEEFNKYRNYIEHHHVKIPNVKYSQQHNGTIKVIFPTNKDGTDLLELLEKLQDKILELVEVTVIFLFSTKLKPGLVIREIPIEERNPEIVKRYAVYMEFQDGTYVRHGKT